MDKIHKASAVANLVKLPYFNEQHIRRIAGGDNMTALLEEAKSLVSQKFGKNFSDEYITNVLKLMKVFLQASNKINNQERLDSIKDVEAFCAYFFADPIIGTSNTLHSKMWKPNSGNFVVLYTYIKLENYS